MMIQSAADSAVAHGLNPTLLNSTLKPMDNCWLSTTNTDFPQSISDFPQKIANFGTTYPRTQQEFECRRLGAEAL